MKTEMSAEARQKANEYQRKWRQNNSDKIKQYCVNYWERKASQESASETLESKVVRLHQQGYSLREIGNKLGVSHMKAKRLLQVVTD
ncbi:MAG: hypothetical protein WCI71_10830 [Bacteroidota bacterium]